MDNCRQLKIVSGVVLPVGLQLTRGIGHNSLLLHQNSTETLKRSITENFIRLGFVRRSQNWSSDEFLFDSVESNVTPRRPDILHMLLEEVGKRLCNLGEILNESSAIACKSKKTAKLLDILRRFPIQNCRHSLRINSNALGRDDMPKAKNFIKPEFTFGELCIEFILFELVEHQSQMLGMILLILGEDQYIIEIDQDEFIGVGVEDEVHHARECWRSIDKAE